MNGENEAIDIAPPRRPFGLYALLALFCFLLGIAAMGWLLVHWQAGARMLGIAPEPPAAAQSPAPARLTLAPPAATTPAPAPATGSAAGADEPQRVIIDPEVSRRVAALEQRMNDIDVQSRSAVGNADRAEGLLVAFAARRALDRGVGLGFLEGLLRQRFGQSQPRAVGMIILAAQHPVTLQDLQTELQDLSPRLIGPPTDAGWWQAFTAQLGTLITVRRAGSPSPEPAERLRRASQRLEAGQVDVALAEVMRLPGRGRAADWIRKARLYADARAALDTIETAALLEPRSGEGPAAPAPTPAARTTGTR
jgi:hypothetical protein